MNYRQQAAHIISEKGGIASAADFVAAGIPPATAVNMCNTGILNRICHGYYQLAEGTSPSEEQLLATLIPEGIVCLESALFHHGYSDFTPRSWSITVPRTIGRARLRITPLSLHVYYVKPELYELGKTTGHFNGTALPLYDRERTICDCFKYRTRLDHETFNKAVHAYAADPHKNLHNLSLYATKLRVYKHVTSLMEVLLNG